MQERVNGELNEDSSSVSSAGKLVTVVQNDGLNSGEVLLNQIIDAF